MRGLVRVATVLVLAAVLVLILRRSAVLARPDPEPSVYVLDSLSRAHRSQPPPHPSPHSVTLAAARGETQGFQIVVYGGSSGLPSLDASIETPVETSFNPAPLTFYREHYTSIATSSYHGEGGARPGVYPDALIPFLNPFTGQRLAPTPVLGPFEAPAGENAAMYVEAKIPATAPAGVYSSTISVTSAGRVIASIPLTLTVWDFAIPEKPSLHSAFQDYDSEHLIGPARYYGYAPSSPQHQAVSTAMDEILLAHRLVPEIPVASYFHLDSGGHLTQSKADNDRVERIANRAARSDLKLLFVQHEPFRDPLHADREKAITYLRESYDWFESRGLLDKVWLRTHDEPHSSNQFRETLEFANLIHEANPHWRVAITGGFDHAGFERILFGHLDMFIMGFDSFEPSKISAAAGFWSYTALVQSPEHPSPYWQIDFPLLNFRIAPWINYRYGLRGLLYWTTAYWNEIRTRGHSPYTDACSVAVHDQCYNGDGLLVYPGLEAGYTIPQNAYGEFSPAAVYGPIPSLRLKALRDGMQDYELLTLAAQKNPPAAMDAALSVGCAGDARANCFHHWNPDPQALFQLRLRLADLIQNRGTSF
jgi:hypothetical protein